MLKVHLDLVYVCVSCCEAEEPTLVYWGKKKIITVFPGRTWLVKKIKMGEIQMKSSVERRIYR